jgi:6-phosphofructokinase 1
MKVGILTSGGDCAGLNAVLRAFGKALFAAVPNAEIYGILDGYAGLVNREYRKMNASEFSGILTLGGTVLGTSRMPYKKLSENEPDKVAAMKDCYRKMGLDVLVVLGGNGSHKTAAHLSAEGLNVVALPKTIDNDIWDTDVTFGFHSALDVATDCIDRIQTTAASHKRTFIVELMGNKAGWLTLYAGIAGGANIILLPELPFSLKKVIEAVAARVENDRFCVIAAAEGIMDTEEAALNKKERAARRQEAGEGNASNRIAKAVADALTIETRVVTPGHAQRGGIPSGYDRILCTQIGAYGASLVASGRFGVGAAVRGGKMTYNSLVDIAGKIKLVPPDHELIKTARAIGVSFGD